MAIIHLQKHTRWNNKTKKTNEKIINSCSKLCIFCRSENQRMSQWRRSKMHSKPCFIENKSFKMKGDENTNELTDASIQCSLWKRSSNNNNWLLSWTAPSPLRLHLNNQNFLLAHLAASRAPHNCSPRSTLTWEDWLQAAACSSREQAWRRTLGGNNFTPDPPLPRPQHELRTGFREREERHRVNQRRKTEGEGRGGRRVLVWGFMRHFGWMTALYSNYTREECTQVDHATQISFLIFKGPMCIIWKDLFAWI